ncbi:tRNA (5-methylaminomethyl-2-thiouridylate)-methyltransferase [Desulfofundulus australicus DSM 11792]|jgi:tRNA-specific 2-thiouridylase|uniref:tRNA-specific 2-thiouridylase MnmA n=1 Tax=Desulfofundulus australicus DSM 11792 TaxID=1121425 RepID=A0A1M4Y8M0_9FIRM|nr:tRNA 2-thiouridine(34) synthase MnmA [Desulfofundulus australicus]SHF02058.1 tRNA (5-methylaminomethyl-2-thiouridylate)-methyltransferase [Desulfofundulus australicus DSM 11792]
MKPRVVVAMSGGVDSSVTAALLVERGYEVIGVTMQIWDPGVTEVAGEHVGCCSLAAVEDARRVAHRLGIPYYVLNFREIFEDKVVNYFCAEYLRGRTPNPCIACNRYIKFESLLNKARALGANYIATGHYARIIYDDGRGRYLLKRAADTRKDQTYVLYNMTQEQLAHTLMPLGDYTKEQVRRMAAERGLPVAEKAESQEICFIPDNDYHNFLKERAEARIEPGPFLDLQGNVIGQHRGIPFYTIGQRRGLGIAAGQRLYVVDIDPERNAVILGPEEAILGDELVAEDNNFILIEKLTAPMEVSAQIRYNSRPAPAVIIPRDDGRVLVRFTNPQRAITPGQSVVYYQNDYVVGGGVITTKGKKN